MKKSGKEATKGQKQIYEENQSTLKFYLQVVLGTNLLYYGLTWVLFWENFTLRYMLFSTFSLIASLGSQQFMAFMARPTFAEGKQQLADAGTDLNMKNGLGEHLKDVIILCSTTQCLSLLTSYFWLLLIVLPARAFHLLWVNILSPLIMTPPADPASTAAEEKKQKKLERKAKRAQQPMMR